MKNMLASHGQVQHRSVASDLSRVVLAACLILLAPLVAMQFTREVNWSAFDFVVAGILLVGAGSLYVLLSRLVGKPRLRLAARLALALGFVLLWGELAVGIFGSPIAGS